MQPLSPLCVLALACALPGQDIAATITPNPAPVGTPITITVNDASGSGFTYDGSAWWAIRQASPAGPVVGPPFGITLPFFGNTGPYGSLPAVTWNQDDLSFQQVPPGTYYFEVKLNNEFFPITIYDPATTTRPQLSVGQAITVGANVPLKLASPSDPGAGYLVYWSRSSNSPINLPGFDVQIDNPFFNSQITGWFGTLDINGDAFPGPVLNIPNLAAVKYQGFVCQAAVFPGGGRLKLSNGLPMRIQ